METKTKKAILDVIKERNDFDNYGFTSHYHASEISHIILLRESISLNNKGYFYEIVQKGIVIGKVKIRYSQKKIDCCYLALTPKQSDMVLY